MNAPVAWLALKDIKLRCAHTLLFRWCTCSCTSVMLALLCSNLVQPLWMCLKGLLPKYVLYHCAQYCDLPWRICTKIEAKIVLWHHWFCCESEKKSKYEDFSKSFIFHPGLHRSKGPNGLVQCLSLKGSFISFAFSSIMNSRISYWWSNRNNWLFSSLYQQSKKYQLHTWRKR